MENEFSEDESNNMPEENPDLPTGDDLIGTPEETRRGKRRRRRMAVKEKREAAYPSCSSDDAPRRKVRRMSPKPRIRYRYRNNIERERETRRQVIVNRMLRDYKCEDFVESVVPKLTDDEFKKLFKITRETHEQLLQCFELSVSGSRIIPSYQKTNVPIKDYLLMFLWFVGQGSTFDALGEKFDVDYEDGICVIEYVADFFSLYDKKLLPFPQTKHDANRLATSFHEHFEIPHTIGSLTVHKMLIEEQPPKCNKLWMTVQTVTDYKSRILDVYVNFEMPLHPRDMLEESPIGQRLKDLCYDEYHLLADRNYYVRNYLMTPFEKAESVNEIFFNERHADAMECAYRAWNNIVERFRILKTPHLTTEYVQGIVNACCMLHNICVDELDDFQGTRLRVGSSNRPVRAVIANRDDPDLRSFGLLKRRQISHDMIG